MGEALREKIIESAARVLMRKGLTGATLDEIAAEAGITKGGVFYYFSGKQEIVLILINRFEQKITAERDRILATLPDTPSSHFRATILAMTEYLRGVGTGMSNIGGLFDVTEYREAIAAMKKRIFIDICERFPQPEYVSIAMVVIDGLWMNNLFNTPFYYEGCKESLLAIVEAYVDSVGNSFDKESGVQPASMLLPDNIGAPSEELYECVQAGEIL